MAYTAIHRHARISARKVRPLADLIRGKAVDDALATGELFLILLKRAQAGGLDTVGSLLAAAEEHQRKVSGGGFGGA